MDKYMKVTTIIIVLAILFVVFSIARVIEFKGIEHEFDTIVAVRSPKKNNSLIPPCGNCRQLLMQYAPNIKVLIQTENGIEKFHIKELLPYSAY